MHNVNNAPRTAEPARTARQAGFTLIEIMVVIVILGILAGLIVPRIMDQPDKARQVKAEMQIESISQALEMYRLEKGKYPTGEQGLKALVPAYLPKVPNDPWGNPYVYRQPGEHGEFDLSSLGADNERGGSGGDKDVNSWETE